LTCSLILLSSILVKTLLGIDRSVIPRQLSQFALSPFFGILISKPHFQSLGISPSFQILSNRVCNIFAVISRSTFNTSGGMLSTPAAFPHFNSFNACFISITVGGLMLILEYFTYSSFPSSFTIIWLSAIRFSTIWLSTPEFRILEKCSCQRCICSFGSIRRVPSVALIGQFLCICLFDKIFVMANSSLRLALFVASSA